VNNHTLALVIYTLSAFNINTIKKTSTFYLFTQHDYDIISTRIYYAHLNHSFVLLLTTQEQPRQRKFKYDLGIHVYETFMSTPTREETYKTLHICIIKLSHGKSINLVLTNHF
jgi:hypothetical protein